MKQSGSVQMKRMVCLSLWKIAWVQTLTSCVSVFHMRSRYENAGSTVADAD